MEQALPIILIGIVGVAIAAASWWWCTSRARDLIDNWATQCGFRVVDSRYCWFWNGPFFLTTSKGQMVYYVTVEDRDGRVRRAWVRCGGWFLGMMSDRVDVEWVD